MARFASKTGQSRRNDWKPYRLLAKTLDDFTERNLRIVMRPAWMISGTAALKNSAPACASRLPAGMRSINSVARVGSNKGNRDRRCRSSHAKGCPHLHNGIEVGSRPPAVALSYWRDTVRGDDEASHWKSPTSMRCRV